MAFERLVETGGAVALGDAVHLYRGDFLQGLEFRGALFEDWLMAERERLRELALDALAKLLAYQRSAGLAEPALQIALRLVALDPLQEPVHRTVMRLYGQLGRRGAALRQYQLCVGVLHRELGVEPEQDTRQLYQEILRGRPVREATLTPATRLNNSPPRTSDRRPSVTPASEIPLIGRDAEIAGLRAMLADAARGMGRAAMCVGEAGIGKSRLMAELATAEEAKGRVLVGRCYESEQILPFAPWIEILRGAVELTHGRWPDLFPPAIRREMGRLLPALGPDGDEATAPPDYLRLFEGVALLLAHVGDRHPVLVLLEDLHWADEMTVRLLAFIARRLASWHLLLLSTARAEELVDATLLQRTLAELDREPHVATIALGPLSRSETHELVRLLSRLGTDRAAADRLSEQVWRTSAGNPFVVVEAMRAAAQDRLSADLERLSVPDRVRDLVGRQLDHLDERSRDLAALASVVGASSTSLSSSRCPDMTRRRPRGKWKS